MKASAVSPGRFHAIPSAAGGLIGLSCQTARSIHGRADSLCGNG